MRAGGPVLQFISTHLDSGRDLENRLAQAESLNRLIVRDDRPSILAGDMNSRIDSEAMDILGMRWTNASPVDLLPTDPAARPQGRVDYLLVRPWGGWRVIEWRVVDAPVASDHQPVLAVLEWIGEP
jgi:endonuclease/exonuclease/phosphatase family metal-dependent hydrolase